MRGVDLTTGLRPQKIFFKAYKNRENIEVSGAIYLRVELLSGSVDLFDNEDVKQTFTKAGVILDVRASDGFVLNQLSIDVGTTGNVLVTMLEGEVKDLSQPR